jgi:iron-sulfur cluster assembly protein
VLARRGAPPRDADGSIQYGMGFDEPGEGEQPSLQADGVTVLIAGSSRALLQDTQLDFVELSPGEFNFIFVPGTPAPQAGCGSCSSGGCASRGGC